METWAVSVRVDWAGLTLITTSRAKTAGQTKPRVNTPIPPVYLKYRAGRRLIPSSPTLSINIVLTRIGTCSNPICRLRKKPRSSSHYSRDHTVDQQSMTKTTSKRSRCTFRPRCASHIGGFDKKRPLKAQLCRARCSGFGLHHRQPHSQCSRWGRPLRRCNKHPPYKWWPSARRRSTNTSFRWCLQLLKRF